VETTINERLDKILNEENLSGAELGRSLVGKTTVKSRGIISKYKTGDRDIPKEVIVDIIMAIPKMNADWFIHDRGEMMYSEEIKNEYKTQKVSKVTVREPSPPEEYNTLKKKYETVQQENLFLKSQITSLQDAIAIIKQKGGCAGELEGGVEKPRSTG
jgi:hypothetical protein